MPERAGLVGEHLAQPAHRRRVAEHAHHVGRPPLLARHRRDPGIQGAGAHQRRDGGTQDLARSRRPRWPRASTTGWPWSGSTPDRSDGGPDHHLDGVGHPVEFPAAGAEAAGL